MSKGRAPTSRPRETPIAEWLADPNRYVRRGEIVSVVARLLEMRERARKPWYKRLWARVRGYLVRNRTPPGGEDATTKT